MKGDTMSRKSDKQACADALAEGLIDPQVAELPVKRWPPAMRVRYTGDAPHSGPDEVTEPLRVDEASA